MTANRDLIATSHPLSEVQGSLSQLRVAPCERDHTRSVMPLLCGPLLGRPSVLDRSDRDQDQSIVSLWQPGRAALADAFDV